VATEFTSSVLPDTPLATAVLDAVHEIADKGLRIVGGPHIQRAETEKGEHLAVIFWVEPMEELKEPGGETSSG
jgi:hypothetical protein